MTNQYSGLHRGPIDHDASSIINAIAESNSEPIGMGQVVFLSTIEPNLLLPMVERQDDPAITSYGIAIGGDSDGVYPSTAINPIDPFIAALAGQGVVVCTRGRCLAVVTAVSKDIDVGDLLMPGGADQSLRDALSNFPVVARALQPIPAGESDVIAIDFQREGVLP